VTERVLLGELARELRAAERTGATCGRANRPKVYIGTYDSKREADEAAARPPRGADPVSAGDLVS
jgi:hypothetical protein